MTGCTYHPPPIYVEIFFPAALGTPMCVLYSTLKWCWIGGGKRRRHWKTGSRTFLLLFDIITDSWLFFRGTYWTGCGYFHWPLIPWNSPCNAHARCTFLRSYYLPEASTPAINISDSWDTSVLGSWSLPLDELTRSSFYSVAGSFLNIMDRVEYEVYDTGNEVYDDMFENDMDLTQEDTEASK